MISIIRWIASVGKKKKEESRKVMRIILLFRLFTFALNSKLNRI